MSEELPAEVVGRLEEAISNVDQISLRVAQILALFDELFYSGKFEIDGFENEVAKRMTLNETEIALLRRALEELQIAQQQAVEEASDPEFLEKTTVTLGKYSQRPKVACDPLCHGIVFIFLKTKADAVQFHLDTESEDMKNLRRRFEALGKELEEEMGIGKPGNFIGELVNLANLGLPIENSFRVISLVIGGATQQLLHSVITHEYMHFIEQIFRRHLHQYFGSTELRDHNANVANFARIPERVRADLITAIGTLKKQRPTLSYESDSSVDTESDPEEIVETLRRERQLLDEMRAHTLGNGFVVPAQMQTTELIFDQGRSSNVRKFDRLMAERYFNVQLRMLSLWIRGGHVYKQGLAVLGAALSLSQAARLLDAIIERTPLDMDDERTRRMTEVIRNTSGEFNFLDYTISGAELISPEEVARYVPELPTD